MSSQLSLLLLKRVSTRTTTHLWWDGNISDEEWRNSAELLSISSKWQWFPCWEQARSSEGGWRRCEGLRREGCGAHRSAARHRSPDSQIRKLHQTRAFWMLISSWLSCLSMGYKPLQPLVMFTVNLFFYGETGWSDKVSKSVKLNYAIENFTGCASVCLVGIDALYKFLPECGQSIWKGASRWWVPFVFLTNKTSNRVRPFRKSSDRVTGSC